MSKSNKLTAADNRSEQEEILIVEEEYSNPFHLNRTEEWDNPADISFSEKKPLAKSVDNGASFGDVNVEELEKKHKQVKKEFKSMMKTEKLNELKTGYKKFDKTYNFIGRDYHELECGMGKLSSKKFSKKPKEIDFVEYESREVCEPVKKPKEKGFRTNFSGKKSIEGKKAGNRLYKEAFKREIRMKELENKYMKEFCTFCPEINKPKHEKRGSSKGKVPTKPGELSEITKKSESASDPDMVNLLINLDNLDEAGNLGLTDPADIHKLNVLKKTIKNAMN